MSDQSIISWIRQPASIILIIALAIMVVMFIDQTSRKPSSLPPVPKPQAVESNTAPLEKIVAPTPVPATKPMAGPIGGEMPKIVQRLGGPPSAPPPTNSQPGQLTAPDLGSLLGRMEEKVKTDPENIDNRLLLAQTYNELGLADKAIAEARAALAKQPDHVRTRLVLASILSSRTGENELKEAVEMLKALKGNSDVKQYLVDMYLGDAWIHMGDHKSAVESWKLALKNMPVADNRRAKIESNIANISTGKGGE